MFGLLLLPLLLLHVLQMIWPLSRVLSPPLLTGVMWSASGLVGRSCVSQVMVTPQSGHSVWPCCLAWVMSRCRQRRCAADAVRLVCAITPPLSSTMPLWALIAPVMAWNVLGYVYPTCALLIDSGGCFVRLRGCSVCAGVVVFHPHPLACEKDHIAPQRCRKKKDTEEKWGSVCSRFKA